jgi:hypothetical protein
MKRTVPISQNPRRLWRPKTAECEKQCPSCPFLRGNNKEFGEVVSKLRRMAQMPPPKPIDIHFARTAIEDDLQFSGDFLCHSTVYTEDMKLRPEEDRRQCPGATKFFRAK